MMVSNMGVSFPSDYWEEPPKTQFGSFKSHDPEVEKIVGKVLKEVGEPPYLKGIIIDPKHEEELIPMLQAILDCTIGKLGGTPRPLDGEIDLTLENSYDWLLAVLSFWLGEASSLPNVAEASFITFSEVLSAESTHPPQAFLMSLFRAYEDLYNLITLRQLFFLRRPDDTSRVTFLQQKLNEYAKRIEDAKRRLEEEHPDLPSEMIELLLAQETCYHQHAILAVTLERPYVLFLPLYHELTNRFTTDDRYDERAEKVIQGKFLKAWQVIKHYCETAKP